MDLIRIVFDRYGRELLKTKSVQEGSQLDFTTKTLFAYRLEIRIDNNLVNNRRFFDFVIVFENTCKANVVDLNAELMIYNQTATKLQLNYDD